MTITLDDFVSAACRLETLGLEWKWIDSTNTHQRNSLGQGYLERVLLLPIKQRDMIKDLPPTLEEEKEANDLTATSTPTAPSPPSALKLISWRFHICYSHSYSEPVLYFQASDQSGTFLPFHEILRELEFKEENISCSGELPRAKEESIPAITHEDHPVLHTPFYMLHPCQTGDIMALLNSTYEPNNYIEPQQPSLSPLTLPPPPPQKEQQKQSPLRYLVAWLCVAGGPLGIAPSPSEYLEILQKATVL